MFSTQSSSKPRLKNETLGDDALRNLYDAFNSMNDREFTIKCIETVQAGGGKQPKKDQIINEIYNSSTRGRKLKLAQDFIMAGMGLGV